MPGSRRVHLVGSAGSCRSLLETLDLQSPRELVQLAQSVLGDAFHVTANDDLVLAEENELEGGRDDDDTRAGDITEALADTATTAIVSLRGGAWFTRILPKIDFTPLDDRTNAPNDDPVTVIGFSEFTPLVNIIAAHAAGIGVYGMGPAFLTYGLRRYATVTLANDDRGDATPKEWAQRRFRKEFESFFADVRSLLTESALPIIAARHVAGPPPRDETATFSGGNLTVLSTMVGSMFERAAHPGGKQWLLLEDFNDKLERMDRFLAHFTLADWWRSCRGILLGDFHFAADDYLEPVLNLLAAHLPADVQIPILHAPRVGHTWPMDNLALHHPYRIVQADRNRYELRAESLRWRIRD